MELDGKQILLGPKTSKRKLDNSLEFSVQFSIANCLGDVFGPYVLTAGQIRYGAGDLADFVVRTGRQAELHHCLFEKHLAGTVQPAEFLNLFVRHSRVGY